MDDLAQIVGKRIVSARLVEDDRYARLEFDDGSAVEFSGLGYDGLWDDVIVAYEPVGGDEA